VGADLLAVEFNDQAVGPGERAPVNAARVVTGLVLAVVAELE
jgi:hypothetical protein